MKAIKFLRFLLMFTVIISMVMISCKKDDDDDTSTPAPNAPYSNMNDDSTTAVNVAIPRIDVTGSRDGSLGIYLSATNQDGWAFSQFTSGNFLIVIENLDNHSTTTVAIISFININQQGGNIAAAMTLDYSGSMSYQMIADMETAVGDFANLKASADIIELLKFSTSAEVTLPFTSNVQDILTAIANPYAGAGGSTAWYDAINLGLDEANSVTNNFVPAIIALTDGYDNNSSVNESEIIAKAQQYQIPIYTIGFGSGGNESVMLNIADQTGGYYLSDPSATQLSQLYSKISGQLKNLFMATVTFTGSGNFNVIVTVSYTCVNGTLTSTGYKGFTYP